MPTDPSQDKDQPLPDSRVPLPDSRVEQTSLPYFDVPSEGDIDLGALQSSKVDEEIPLASLPEPPSGQSLTSWTEVIRRQRAVAQAGRASAGEVRVDAPSDKDILIKFDEIKLPRRTGDTSEILPGDLPVFTGPTGRSESDIDLGLIKAGGTGESEVKFDILFPPSDAAGVMPAPDSAPLSAIDFRAATPVSPSPSGQIPFATAVDQSASGVNLGDDTGPPGEGGRSSILDALLTDSRMIRTPGGSSGSVLDFGTAPVISHKPTVPTATRPAVPTPPGIDLGGSAPELAGRDIVDSSADLGSEDAIDLYAEPAASPNITDSGTLEISEKAIEESQRRAEFQESSSVDLSSRPSYHGAEFENALEAPSAVDLKSDADIDLNLPAVEDDGNSSMVHREPLEVNSEALAAEFRARRQAREGTGEEQLRRKAKRTRDELVPVRDDSAGAGRTGYLLRGSVLGLIVGAGGVLGAYFVGALPDRHAAGKGPTIDNSAELVRLKQDADAARKDAVDAKGDVARQVDDARKTAAAQIQQLTEARAAGEAQARKLMGDAQKAQADRTAALKVANDAKIAEQTAKDNLQAAAKAADEAKGHLATALMAKKTADDALTGLTKSIKDAGIDSSKPDEGIKKLMGARTAAEAKAKDADAKVAESTKKITDLTTLAETTKKSYEEARKSAEDAVKARDASDATVRAVADRLAKAKFVGEKADMAAILKGIDDAVKAGGTDATAALRDELKKARELETKAQADLTASKDREAEATKAAQVAKAEAQKLAVDGSRLKTENEKLSRDSAEAAGKIAAAEKAAATAHADAERSASEVARLKAETDRLTRDLETVKELAELIKTPATQAVGPLTKPDPERLAETFFGDGVRAYHRGQTSEAESSFRKALQFRPSDARYHYLLGLTLWTRKETAGAEAEFEKGRDLELAGRPTSRTISAALERIQGPARLAVDAYRP
jgi:hypothetical protein